MNLKKPILKTSDNRYDGVFPFQVLMETTSYCPLKCVMCARRYVKIRTGIMEEGLKHKIIDEVAEAAPETRFWFCYFGEPLILKAKEGFFKSIRYAKDKGIKTTIINTTANLLDEQATDNLIEAGLDEIYIGIDAIKPETYHKIRIGGNYQTVMKNIDYLLKKARNNPKVTVQFGVYEENEGEVEDFKKYWESRDVKVFIRPKLTWIGTVSDYENAQKERYACPWIFDTLAIDFDGLVPYCVCERENRMPVGDVKTQSIKEIWQNKARHYQEIHLRKEWDKLPEFCQKCRDWQTKPFADYLKRLSA